MLTKNVALCTSIVDSFHEPALRAQVFIDAIQRRLFFTFPATRLNGRSQRPHFDVPFIARPGCFRPPVAFRSPRSCERQDSPACSLTTKKCRLFFLKFHGCRKRGPEYAHCRSRFFSCGCALFLYFRQNKTVLLKRVGAVCIKQCG